MTTQIKLLLLLTVALTTVGCDKTSQTTTHNDGEHVPRVEARPFHGEVYRSIDGNTALTLISSEELELREGKTTLLCKYSKQTETLRVIITSLGTSQIVYFRFTDKGLQDNEGKTLLSPTNYVAAIEEDRKKKELSEKCQQVQNEYDQATKLVANTLATEENRLLLVKRKEENDVISRHSATSNEIESTHDQQLNKAKKALEETLNAAEEANSKSMKEAKEQDLREDKAETKDLEIVAKAYPATPELHKKAYDAEEKIRAIHQRHAEVRGRIEDRYKAKLKQETDKLQRAYQEEEARLKSESEAKIAQNDQSKDRELREVQLRYNKSLEPFILKGKSDLAEIFETAKRKVDEWHDKIMK